MFKSEFAAITKVHAEDVVETTWNGEHGFEYQFGFMSVDWFPTPGWGYNSGRGITGRAKTYAEAVAAEEYRYNASWKEFNQQ